MMYICNPFEEIEDAFCNAINSIRKIHQISYFPNNKVSAQETKTSLICRFNSQPYFQWAECNSADIIQDGIFLVEAVKKLIKAASIIDTNRPSTYGLIINYSESNKDPTDQKPEIMDILENIFPNTKIILVYMYKAIEDDASRASYKNAILNKIPKALNDNNNRSWIVATNFAPFNTDIKEIDANTAVVNAAVEANALPMATITPNPSEFKTFINSLITKTYAIGVPTNISYSKPDGSIVNQSFNPVGFGSPVLFDSQAFFNAIINAGGYTTAATPNDVLTFINNARATVANKYSEADFINLINILHSYINANTYGSKASDVRDFINKLSLLSYTTGVPTNIPYTANVLRNINRTFTPIGAAGPASFNAIDFFNTVKNKPGYSSATTTSDIINLFSALSNTPGKYSASDGTNMANALAQWTSNNGAGATVPNMKNYINTISDLVYNAGQPTNINYSVDVLQGFSKSFIPTGSAGPIIFDKVAFFNTVTGNPIYGSATATSDIINLFSSLTNTPGKYSQADGAAMATILNQWISNNGAGATVANLKNYISTISALDYTVGTTTNSTYIRNSSQMITNSFTPTGGQGPSKFDQAAFFAGFINNPNAQSSATAMQNYFNTLAPVVGKYSAQDGQNMANVIGQLSSGRTPDNQILTYLSQFFCTLSLGTTTNLSAAAGFGGIANFTPQGSPDAFGKVGFDQAAFFNQFQANSNQINTLQGILNYFNSLSNTPGQYSAQDGKNMVTAINTMTTNGLTVDKILSVLSFFCRTISVDASTSLTNSETYYPASFQPVGCPDVTGKIIFDQAAFFANFMQSPVYSNPNCTITQIQQFFNSLSNTQGKYSATDGINMANAIKAYAYVSVPQIPDSSGFVVINKLQKFTYTLSPNTTTNITGVQGPFRPIGSPLIGFSATDFFNAVTKNPAYASATKMSTIINLFKNLPNAQLKYGTADGSGMANLLMQWVNKNGTNANVATMKAYIANLAGLSYTIGSATNSNYIINSSQTVSKSFTPVGAVGQSTFDQAAFFNNFLNNSPQSSISQMQNYLNTLTPVQGKYSLADGQALSNAIGQMASRYFPASGVINFLTYFAYTLSPQITSNLMPKYPYPTYFTPVGCDDGTGKIIFNQAAFFSGFLNIDPQSATIQNLQNYFGSLSNSPGQYSAQDGINMAKAVNQMANSGFSAGSIYYNLCFFCGNLSINIATNLLAVGCFSGSVTFTPTGCDDGNGNILFNQAAFFNNLIQNSAYQNGLGSNMSVSQIHDIFYNLTNSPGQYSAQDGINMANAVNQMVTAGQSPQNIIQILSMFFSVCNINTPSNLVPGASITFSPVGSAPPAVFNSTNFFNAVTNNQSYISASSTSDIINLFNSLSNNPGKYSQNDGATIASILTQWVVDNRDQATVSNMKNYIDILSMGSYAAGTSTSVNYNIIPMPTGVQTSFTPVGAPGIVIFDKIAFFNAVTNNNAYDTAANPSVIINLFANLTNTLSKYSQADGSGMSAVLTQWASNNRDRATVVNMKTYITTISALTYTAGASTDISYNIITTRGIVASFTPQGQPGISFKSQDFFAAAMASSGYISPTSTILAVINSFSSLTTVGGKYSQADGITMSNILLEWHSYNNIVGNAMINLKNYISNLSRLTYSSGNPTNISYSIPVPTPMSTVFTPTGAPGPAMFSASDLITAVTGNPGYTSATIQSIITMFKALPDTINKYSHADGVGIGNLLAQWFNDLTYPFPNASSVKHAAVSALTSSNSQAFANAVNGLDIRSADVNTSQAMLNAIQALATEASYARPDTIAQAFQNTKNINVKVLDGPNFKVSIEKSGYPYAIMISNYNISSLILEDKDNAKAKLFDAPHSFPYLYQGYLSMISNPKNRIYGICKSG